MGYQHSHPTGCLSLKELEDYALGASPATEAHLNSCARCRGRLALVTATRGGSAEIASTPIGEIEVHVRVQPSRVLPQTPLSIGRICSIASDERPGERLIVVVLSGGGIASHEPLTVAPISAETRFATEWDQVVAAGHTPLLYAHLIEIWNRGRVSRAQFDEVLGDLRQAETDILTKLWQASLGESDPPESVAAVTGPPVVNRVDPRVDFQRDETERVRAFYEPWLDHVLALAGPFTVALREGLESLGDDEVAAAAHVERSLVTAVRGSGFIRPPDPYDLGRLAAVASLDLHRESSTSRKLAEEASAWIENTSPGQLKRAARTDHDRAKTLLHSLLGFARKQTVGELDGYLADVRRAAAEFNGPQRS